MTNFRRFNKAEMLEDGRIRTPWFRCDHPQIFEPRSFKGQPEKYSVIMLFDEEQVDLSVMREAAKKALTEKFGSKIPKQIKATLKSPFRHGSEERDSEDYEGKIFMRCSSDFQPGIVGPKGKTLTDETAVYRGCYMRATLECYAYSYENVSNGVGFGLRTLQLLADGPPILSTKSTAEDDFEDVTGSEDEPANNETEVEDNDDLDDLF